MTGNDYSTRNPENNSDFMDIVESEKEEGREISAIYKKYCKTRRWMIVRQQIRKKFGFHGLRREWKKGEGRKNPAIYIKSIAKQVGWISEKESMNLYKNLIQRHVGHMLYIFEDDEWIILF